MVRRRNVGDGIKTFESFRTTCIEHGWVGIRFPSHDRMPAWGREAPTSDVRGWIDRVKETGLLQADRVRCVALIASERARSGQREEARALLKDAEAAEKARNKKDDAEDGARQCSLTGLIPAWWQTGDPAKAKAGLKELAAATAEPDDDFVVAQVVALAALGGQWDVAIQHLKRLLSFSELGSPRHAVVLSLAIEDGHAAAIASLSNKHVEPDRKNDEDAYDDCWVEARGDTQNCRLSAVSDETCGVARALRAEPARYIDLLSLPLGRRRTSRRESMRGRMAWALTSLERAEPKLAVERALQVLEDHLKRKQKRLSMWSPDGELFGTAHALAIVATHAPKLAQKWASSYNGRTRYGRAPEVRVEVALRAALGRDLERIDLTSAPPHELAAAARATADRPFALRAARAAAELATTKAPYHWGDLDLDLLVQLGDERWLDAFLQKRCDRMRTGISKKTKATPAIAKAPSLCLALAQAGRAPLAFDVFTCAASHYEEPDERNQALSWLVEGCAAAGDWEGATRAIGLAATDPRGDRYLNPSRADLAWLALRVGEEAFVDGPRAIPLRCLG